MWKLHSLLWRCIESLKEKMVPLVLAHKCRISLAHVLCVFRSVVHEGGAAAVSCQKQKDSGGRELKFSLVSSGREPNPIGNERSFSFLSYPISVTLLESGEKSVGPWSERGAHCILYNSQNRKERGEWQMNMEMITLQRLISFQVQMKGICYPISPGICTALKRHIYTIMRISTHSEVSTGTSFSLRLGSGGKTDLLKVRLQHYILLKNVSWQIEGRLSLLLFERYFSLGKDSLTMWGRKKNRPDRIWYYKSFTSDKIFKSIMEK